MSARDAYVEKLKAQLDEWNAELDKLQARLRGARADAKIDYEKQIKTLRQQRDEATTKLAEIQEASEDAWEDLKQGMENTWTALKEAFERAKSRFK